MVRLCGTTIFIFLAIQFTTDFCSSIENRNRNTPDVCQLSFNSTTKTEEENDFHKSKSKTNTNGEENSCTEKLTGGDFKVTPTVAINSTSSQSQGQGKRETGSNGELINSLNVNKFQQSLLKGVDEDDLQDEDFEHWSPPDFIQRNYPYYLSDNYDDNDRPIWVAEFGKFDVRFLVEKGADTVKIAEKSARQAAWRILKSIKDRSTDEKPVSDAAFIIDFDGLQVRQITSLPCLTFVLRLALLYKDLILNHLGLTVVINTNFVADHIIRMVKPVFGPIMEKVDVYGTRKSKWQPTLRRIFGDKPIPPWYGGSDKNFKPVAVYGR